MNIFVQSRISSLMYSFTLFSKSLNMSFDSPSFFHWSNKDLFSGDLIVGYTLLSFATVKIFAIICLLYKIIDIVQIFLYTCGPMALWPCGLFVQWLWVSAAFGFSVFIHFDLVISWCYKPSSYVALYSLGLVQLWPCDRFALISSGFLFIWILSNFRPFLWSIDPLWAFYSLHFN